MSNCAPGGNIVDNLSFYFNFLWEIYLGLYQSEGRFPETRII